MFPGRRWGRRGRGPADDHGFLRRFGGPWVAPGPAPRPAPRSGETSTARPAAKILVVDDEPGVRELVGLHLRRDGHGVIAAADGGEALRLFRRIRPDLVVLDLTLPGPGGLAVCRRIRSERRVPLIVLAARGREEDGIAGLDLGADDYVVKPFSPRELAARVRAVLRRSKAFSAGPAGGGTLDSGGLRLEPDARKVTVRGGTPVTLTQREFDLLYHLASHPGRVHTRAQLMETVWGHAFPIDTRTVTVHVRRLRRPSHPAAGEVQDPDLRAERS